VKAVRGEGSLAEALIASLVLGGIVALGIYCIISFWGMWEHPPAGSTNFGAWLPALVVGVLTGGFMLWLFLARALRVRDIWQGLKDFWNDLGKEPF
jgi:drug/metabolite transporter (DMT)-like permease